MVQEEDDEAGAPERPYHHGNLMAALLAVARDMLERDGPEAISLRAVAKAAGVSRTAPYNHFGGREDLLAALAGDGFRALAASQRATAETTPPGEARLVALGRGYVGFALAHPQLYRLMFGAGVTDWGQHPEVQEAKSASFGPVREALSARLGSRTTNDTLRTAAVSAWALVHGLSMLLLDGSLHEARETPDKIDALIRRILVAFAVGLGADR